MRRRPRSLAWYESLARIALLVPASMTQVLSDLSTELTAQQQLVGQGDHVAQEHGERAAVGRQIRWPESRRERHRKAGLRSRIAALRFLNY